MNIHVFPPPVHIPAHRYGRSRPLVADAWRLADVRALVCAVAGITRADIAGPSQKFPAVAARAVFYWLAPQLTNASLTQIVRAVERDDHTTALIGARRMQAIATAHGIVLDCDDPTPAIEALLAAHPRRSRLQKPRVRKIRCAA